MVLTAFQSLFQSVMIGSLAPGASSKAILKNPRLQGACRKGEACRFLHKIAPGRTTKDWLDLAFPFPEAWKSHLQWIIWMIGFVDGKTYLLVLKWLSFEMALTCLLSLFKGCCIMNPANALTGQVVTWWCRDQHVTLNLGVAAYISLKPYFYILMWNMRFPETFIDQLVWNRKVCWDENPLLSGHWTQDFSDQISQNPRTTLKTIRSCTYHYISLLVGGLEHEFYDFPYIGNNNPNWRTHIFQRGRSTTNQITCFIHLKIHIDTAICSGMVLSSDPATFAEQMVPFSQDHEG